MHKNKFQMDQRLNTKSNRNLEDKIIYCKNQYKQSSKTSGEKICASYHTEVIF